MIDNITIKKTKDGCTVLEVLDDDGITFVCASLTRSIEVTDDRITGITEKDIETITSFISKEIPKLKNNLANRKFD